MNTNFSSNVVNRSFTTPAVTSPQSNPTPRTEDATSTSGPALQSRRAMPRQSSSTSDLMNARIARQDSRANANPAAFVPYLGPGEPIPEEHSVLAQFAPGAAYGNTRNETGSREAMGSEPQPTAAQVPQSSSRYRGPGEPIPEEHSVLIQFAPQAVNSNWGNDTHAPEAVESEHPSTAAQMSQPTSRSPEQEEPMALESNVTDQLARPSESRRSHPLDFYTRALQEQADQKMPAWDEAKREAGM